MSKTIIRDGKTIELTAEEIMEIVSGYLMSSCSESALFSTMNRYSKLMDKWFFPYACSYARHFPDPEENVYLRGLRREGGLLFECDPILRLCELFHYLFSYKLVKGTIPEESSPFAKILQAVTEIENKRKNQIENAIRDYKMGY